MSVYKLLIICTRKVTRGQGTGYEYEDEERAYADCLFFSSQRKAQDYMQQYSTVPLDWTMVGEDIICTETPEFDANIYFEADEFDPRDMVPLPTSFLPRQSHGD